MGWKKIRVPIRHLCADQVGNTVDLGEEAIDGGDTGLRHGEERYRAMRSTVNPRSTVGPMTSERSISSWDDFPVHQTPEFIRHVATSDRNFYDRYYFNMHSSSDEFFAIFSLGQYPNLGTTDAFLAVTKDETQRIMRASKPLQDRRDVSVGPLRIEVIEPLHTLRVIVEPNDADISMDVTWTGSIPAIEEPRQYLRSRGTVVFDTQRFAQLGRWEGTLTVAGEQIAITPERCGGNRDRSWGIRPVGEKQPDGIRQSISVMPGMWNYMPHDYGDHSIVYMCHEKPDGTRPLEEAIRVWSDPSRPAEWLGRPEWEHDMISGSRLLRGSRLHLPDAPDGPITIDVKPLITNFISIGTGYGIDDDWRHGMWQGEDEVVQALVYGVDEIRDLAQYGIVDSVAEFRYGDNVGYGLYEHGFFGPFPLMQLHERGDLHP